MKEYKVIKEFGSAKKGDVLTYDKDCELYQFEIKEKGSNRFMCMDEETADEFVEQGNLICVSDEEDECTCPCCDKLDKLSEFVDTMIDQYENDHKEMNEKYGEGELPTCVKVEADTVYYNMTKILNKVKDIINE